MCVSWFCLNNGNCCVQFIQMEIACFQTIMLVVRYIWNSSSQIEIVWHVKTL
jgi:hypothetical protein